MKEKICNNGSLFILKRKKMKILVKSRKCIELLNSSTPNWIQNKWIISIYSKNSYSPLPDRYNVLKLQFDDVTEVDNYHDFIHFNDKMAEQIMNFIDENEIESHQKDFYVHCDAGISRSGAIGFLLNEYFNKFLFNNKEDNSFFVRNNRQIFPNPEVKKILRKRMFGEIVI